MFAKLLPPIIDDGQSLSDSSRDDEGVCCMSQNQEDEECTLQEDETDFTCTMLSMDCMEVMVNV